MVDFKMRNGEKPSEEQLSLKLDCLEFDSIEDRWNNFRKIIYEVADGVLGEKVRNVDRNISEKAFMLIERRRCLYKKHLSGRSYENKRDVKKVEKDTKT